MREISLQGDAAQFCFPRIRDVKELQRVIPEGEMILAVVSTSRGMLGFALGNKKDEYWPLASAGKLTATPPTGNNEVIKPMAVVTYLNSEMIMLQHRGEVISTAGVSIADDSVTNAKLANTAAYNVKGNETSSDSKSKKPTSE